MRTPLCTLLVAARSTGHVIFRLYWEDGPIYTLAMGPTMHVCVAEKDFEATVRFILYNFKSKKTNPTSLSSLHSLAVVLETPLRRPNDSAARAVWGCIQESRKVVEADLYGTAPIRIDHLLPCQQTPSPQPLSSHSVQTRLSFTWIITTWRVC
jgi:hypothetical protein